VDFFKHVIKNLPKRWEAVVKKGEYITDWLFVWKINYLEALTNRRNLSTNPINLLLVFAVLLWCTR
jgi:hypothetical protein